MIVQHCPLPPDHPARESWPVVVQVDQWGVPIRHHPEAAKTLLRLGATLKRVHV